MAGRTYKTAKLQDERQKYTIVRLAKRRLGRVASRVAYNMKVPAGRHTMRSRLGLPPDGRQACDDEYNQIGSARVRRHDALSKPCATPPHLVIWWQGQSPGTNTRATAQLLGDDGSTRQGWHMTLQTSPLWQKSGGCLATQEVWQGVCSKHGEVWLQEGQVLRDWLAAQARDHIGQNMTLPPGNVPRSMPTTLGTWVPAVLPATDSTRSCSRRMVVGGSGGAGANAMSFCSAQRTPATTSRTST